MHRKLRNLPRSRQLRAAPPIAIAPQRVHIRQNPGCNNKIRLFTRLALQVEPNRNSFIFKANEQIFGQRDRLLIGSRLRPSSDGFNEGGRNGRRELPPWQKETKAGLFNPRTRIVQRESSKAVLAHPFGARLY
jgi:hypothetical protein